MESSSELCPYLPLSGLTDMFTWNRHQNFALICPYPALQICLHGISIRISPLFAFIWPYRYVYIESPSELHPYSPLSHLQTYLHGITIWTLPLFALIPPADMFTLNLHQNFALIRPYPTCRHVYMESPSEFRPYSPLSGLTDIFTCNRHHGFALIHPYLALQICLHWITIRISPLFALIPPTDMFTLNRHQSFALIRPYPTCRHVYLAYSSDLLGLILYQLLPVSVVQISTSWYNICHPADRQSSIPFCMTFICTHTPKSKS